MRQHSLVQYLNPTHVRGASNCTRINHPPPAPEPTPQPAPAPIPSTAPPALSRYISDCPRYTFEQLRVATKNFHEGLLLGVGGFGKVYRGVTADGQHIAVKALTPNGLQVRMHHPMYSHTR